MENKNNARRLKKVARPSTLEMDTFATISTREDRHFSHPS